MTDKNAAAWLSSYLLVPVSLCSEGNDMGLNQHASDLNSSSFTCTQLSFSKLGTPPDRRLPFGAPRPSKTRPPILITPYGQLLFLLSWYPMLWFQAETNRTMRKSPKIQPNHHKVCPWSLKANKSKDNPPVLFLFWGGGRSPPEKKRQTDRQTHPPPRFSWVLPSAFFL